MTLHLCKQISSGLSIGIFLFTQLIPGSAAASAGFSIHINTINGNPPVTGCFEASSIALSGSGIGSTPSGSIQNYDVQIDWDDGDVDTGSADGIMSSFTPATGSGNFAYSFNANHAFLSPGTYIVTVTLIRHNHSEEDALVTSMGIRLCMMIPTTGTITVVKQVMNDDGGTRDVADFPLLVNQTVVQSGIAHNFAPGTYTVSETNIPGYSATFNGDCSSSGRITLGVGDHRICTIINDDVAPRLTLYKHVINDNGGQKQISDFTLKIDGTSVLSGEETKLSAGTHQASEVNLLGYQASYWSGNCASDGTIALALGDDKQCHITNNDIPPPPSCITCEKDVNGNPVVVVVDQDVTVDFRPNAPTCTGDPDLCAVFTYDIHGPTQDTWKAIFTLGGKALRVLPGKTITVRTVDACSNKEMPGIVITSTCTATFEQNSNILVTSRNKRGGDIIIRVQGNIYADGIIRNETLGTTGMPGKITVASMCGNISQGQTGLIQVLGVDPGGNDVNLLACNSGNVTTHGLVMTRAHAHGRGPRPNINIAAFYGAVSIHGDTLLPLYDEYNYGGTRYDLWGGLLSWVTANVNPGKIQIQAQNDISVFGHKTQNRKSFGTIASATATGDPHGGIIDARSTSGNINATNWSFDVSGRNMGHGNVAHTMLQAAKNIVLAVTGGGGGMPVVDASVWGGDSHGGINTLRAYQGNITIGAGATLSAASFGTHSVAGMNFLTTASGVVNNGIITPSPMTATASGGSPQPIFSGCGEFMLP